MGPGRLTWRAALVLAVLAGWLGLYVAGCSSDDPSRVGLGLVESHIDISLDTLLVTEILDFTGKNLYDPGQMVSQQEMLYLGSQGGTTSSILVNYDFSDVFTDSLPEEIWTPDNISWVRLQMIMADHYISLYEPEEEEEGEKVIPKVYEVFQLEAPFDTTAYPAAVPPHDLTDLNVNPILDDAGEVNIDLAEAFFLNWVAAGDTLGLLVQEGGGSDQGLSGFAARDNRHMGSQFLSLGEGTTQGPALRIQFVEPDTIVSIKPIADTSTFHQLAQAPVDPADGFMLRTCQRSYPILRFNLAELPPNVYINRAVLYVVNDTTTSFGNLESIVISEFDMNFFGSPGDSMPLPDLEFAVYRISGMSSLDPTYNSVMQFNVTQAIQRIVNSVYEGEKGLIMTAGEDIFPSYDLSSVDPDFYFTQFNFFGTAADDSLRPQLRITYSGLDELTGGGE
jgi:hypothetical protein